MFNRLKESVDGAMLGMASGDALGAAVENLTFDQIRQAFPDGLHNFEPGVPESLLAGLPAGTYTDDTVMALGLARTYVESTGVLDLEVVARHWVHWKQEGPYWSLGPGISCNEALERLIAGVSPTDSGIEGAAGNGTAMRVAPVGLIHWNDAERCRADAIAQSRITHVHPEADAGAACMARAIAFLVENHRQDFSDTAFWALLEQEAERHSPVFRDALRQARDAEAAPLNVTGYVTRSVPGALRHFIDQRLDLEQAVCNAASAGGDTDTTAALVGALAGAYLGVSAIPGRWLEGLRGASEVREVADALYQVVVKPMV